jgi:hypothetical protein
MSPQAVENLLVAAQLAHFHKKWGFSVRKVNWKLFIEGHQFATTNCMGTFEVDDMKVDLNAFMNGMSPKHRVKIHFIWIGILHLNSPRKIEMQKDTDGQMIVTPPQLNGLWLKQQSFRQCIEKYKWNYVLEDNADKDHEDGDNNKDNKDNSNVDNKHTTSSPTTSNKKRKYNAVMVTPGDEDIAKSDMAKSYPHLSQSLGGEDRFDPTIPSVLKSMHSLLRELHGLLSTSYELNTADNMSSTIISYVQVPQTKSDRSFLSSKELIDTAIQISGSKHGRTFESAYHMTNHIIRFYCDSFLAACETQQIPICKPMCASQFQAMLCAGKVSGIGEKE